MTVNQHWTMWTPDFEKEIHVGEHEAYEFVRLSFPLWKFVLLQLSNKILTILDKFDSEEPYFDFEVQTNERDKIRLFFFAGFINRSKIYIPIYTILLIIVALDIQNLISFAINLQIYGLMLDIVGAIAVALGLFRGVEGIKRDTDTRSIGAIYGGRTWKDKKSLSAVVRKTMDGAWGTIFLFSGFSVQIIAVSGLVR